jgi:homoserine dehydrogenase
MTTPVVRVGVIGAGFVGSALIGLLSDPTRTGALVDAATASLEIVGVAVKDVNKPRPGISPDLLSTDAAALAARADLAPT